MEALIWTGSEARVVHDRVQPRLRPAYLLVRVKAVALNPTDCKAISQGRAATNGLLGCDFAGVVEDIGAEVTKIWMPGDRVFGCVHGANFNEPEDGAFAELIAVKGDTAMRIPDGVSFEEAATMGVSTFTCGQGLFQKMGLGLPGQSDEDKKDYLLIYGGSTSCGALGIQLATLAGYIVLVTCSPNNFDFCKSLGAEAAFDYRDTACGQQIHDYTGGKLRLIWDTIGSEEGVKICMEVLTSDADARYGTILFNKIPRENVIYSSSFLMTFLGEAFDKFGMHMEARPEDFEFAKDFATLVEELLSQGKLKSHPLSVSGGGLQGIVDDGVGLMNGGKVSGRKLVFRIADSP